jgi:hypothetical protein
MACTSTKRTPAVESWNLPCRRVGEPPGVQGCILPVQVIRTGLASVLGNGTARLKAGRLYGSVGNCRWVTQPRNDQTKEGKPVLPYQADETWPYPAVGLRLRWGPWSSCVTLARAATEAVTSIVFGLEKK